MVDFYEGTKTDLKGKRGHEKIRLFGSIERF